MFTFPEGPEPGDPAHRRYIDPTYPLCEDCIRRRYEGGALVLRFTEPAAGPLAETSHELFRAARVLLREHVTDEDQIIPTLMVAHAIDRDAAKERHWAATKKEIIRSNLKRPPRARNLGVAEVVDGILILKWELIVAQLVWEPIFSGLVWEGTSQQLEGRSWKMDGSEPLTRRWKSRPPWSRSLTDQARPDRVGILIRVYPYKEKIEAQEPGDGSRRLRMGSHATLEAAGDPEPEVPAGAGGAADRDQRPASRPGRAGPAVAAGGSAIPRAHRPDNAGPAPELSSLSWRMRDLIRHGNSGEYRSRSEADMAACVAMFDAGFEEAQVWAVMTDPTNGISEKYFEKGRQGERYLALTISKAANAPWGETPRSGRSKARRVRRAARV